MVIYRLNVQVDYPGGGGPGLNTWHVRTQTGIGELGAAVTEIKNFYHNCRFSFPTSVTHSFSGEAIQDPYGAPSYASADPWTETGQGNSGMLSPLLCVVAGWRTSAATRKGHGRTFLGPLDQSAQESDGSVKAGHVTSIKDAATYLIGQSLSDNGWAVGVYSREDHVLRDFTGVRVRNEFGYLSTRRP